MLKNNDGNNNVNDDSDDNNTISYTTDEYNDMDRKYLW